MTHIGRQLKRRAFPCLLFLFSLTMRAVLQVMTVLREAAKSPLVPVFISYAGLQLSDFNRSLQGLLQPQHWSVCCFRYSVRFQRRLLLRISAVSDMRSHRLSRPLSSYSTTESNTFRLSVRNVPLQFGLTSTANRIALSKFTGRCA